MFILQICVPFSFIGGARCLLCHCNEYRPCLWAVDPHFSVGNRLGNPLGTPLGTQLAADEPVLRLPAAVTDEVARLRIRPQGGVSHCGQPSAASVALTVASTVATVGKAGVHRWWIDRFQQMLRLSQLVTEGRSFAAENGSKPIGSTTNNTPSSSAMRSPTLVLRRWGRTSRLVNHGDRCVVSGCRHIRAPVLYRPACQAQ